MKLTLIGDVHGRIDEYLAIVSKHKNTIQLGDMGVGFPGIEIPKSQKDKFIRGNHDNPYACRAHPNYLGEWGFYRKIFFISGAYSIDYDIRTPGFNWWYEEELDIEELEKVMKEYLRRKPQLVISHEAPYIVNQDMYGESALRNRTNVYLDKMFKLHQPDYWYFAHHHKSKSFLIDKTIFRCINTLETITINA